MSRQAEARKQNRTVVRGEEKPSDVDYTSISPDQATAKAIVAKLQIPRNQTQKVSASGAAVRATNGDFVQPKMLPAIIATKRDITSLSVAARSATQTKYMK